MTGLQKLESLGQQTNLARDSWCSMGSCWARGIAGNVAEVANFKRRGYHKQLSYRRPSGVWQRCEGCPGLSFFLFLFSVFRNVIS